MTLAEITAKLNELLGLKEKVTALESGSATAAQLLAETEARKASDAKVIALEAKLAAAAATPPPAKGGEEQEEASVTDAIKALENAITVLKGIAGQGAAPEEKDDEAKAEDSADMSDDEEAMKATKAKHFSKALAIRAQQKLRKEKVAMKKQVAANDKALEAKVTAKIAALGIQTPLALNKDGKNPIRAEKPDGRRRAHKLIAGGFNEQPAIAALNASLGRVVRN